MRNYTLEAYEDKLVHQVIHLDQGACYSPEFRATKMMHDYPSRKLQVAWSIYRGYLPPTEYAAHLLFQSLLSRQGERWQNFGESPEDLTDVMILCRELLVQRGFAQDIIRDLRQILKANDGHVCTVTKEARETWQKSIPTDPASNVYLLLDDATAACVPDGALMFGDYFREKGMTFYPEIRPTFAGWEYFAYGLVDEGITHLKDLVAHLTEKHIATVMVLSGQVEYLLGKYCAKLPIGQPCAVVNVLDDCKSLKVREPSYLYAGSFNLRYLDKSKAINALLTNDKEEAIKHCAEFTPLFKADKRVNQLNRWQKPVCAEYCLVGCDPSITGAIERDAMADIAKSSHSQIVVFEPYAYKVLKDKAPGERITYFADVL